MFVSIELDKLVVFLDELFDNKTLLHLNKFQCGVL